MNRWWVAFLLGMAGVAGSHAADEAFTKALGTADFAAAGRGKLSPEEIARLEITPGVLGTFWMTVEGVRPRVTVTPVGGYK